MLRFFVAFICLVANPYLYAESLDEAFVFSPDKSLSISIAVENGELSYSLFKDEKRLLGPNVIDVKTNKSSFSDDLNIEKSQTRFYSAELIVPVASKAKHIKDEYNELKINLSSGYSLIFRAYDEGAAYRVQLPQDSGEIFVEHETVEFKFTHNYEAFYPRESSHFTHFEQYYEKIRLSQINSQSFGILPMLVKAKNYRVLISEAALRDYPGMFLRGTDESGKLIGEFVSYPKKELAFGGIDKRNYRIVESEDYIAKKKQAELLPWRMLVVAESDKDLLTTDLVYKLSPKLELKDTSWIQPGKVAWDWWNANNVYGVDFKAGINNKTYKYYIDFAAKYGLEYIILDEGWSDTWNILKEAKDINIKELVDYAKKKNVKVILWVLWNSLDHYMKEALDTYEQWGVAGIKVDFMQRDDQKAVDFYWRTAKEAAKRKMLVNFHGSYKPTGIRRAYPNVITREGVRGLEQNKFGNLQTPEQDLMIPFIRMAVGPVDYTPGAMRNAQDHSFNPVFKRPMSQGTRAHQVAMYGIYESPLQMLSDSPSNYLNEKETTKFISKFPTTWDETIPLQAKVGEYIAVAKRSGSKYFLSAMTGKRSRKFSIDLSFLQPGKKYNVVIYRDGYNSDLFAEDYILEKKTVSNTDNVLIEMSKGGGYSARFEPLSK